MFTTKINLGGAKLPPLQNDNFSKCVTWDTGLTYTCKVHHSLFRKKVLLYSRDIQVFFLTIPWFTKSVTAWWVLVHETGCIFEYTFWTTTH